MRADIYSLGMTLIHVLWPDAADRPQSLARDADSALVSLLMSTIEDSPERRPESAAAVAARLSDLLAEPSQGLLARFRKALRWS